MAEFYAPNVKVMAKLSTGHIITCTTDITAEGSYIPNVDTYIGENTIEAWDDEYFSPSKEGAHIVKILKILQEPEWDVTSEDSGYDPDYYYDCMRDVS